METTLNQHQKRRGSPAIVASLVSDQVKRAQCLARVAGFYAGRLEYTVVEMLEKLDQDHASRVWDFYSLSNGGFYMAPASDRVFRLVSVHGFAAEVSANVAGIVASVMAYSDLEVLEGGERFTDAHHLLTNYISQMHSASAGVIRAVLE